MAETAGVYDNDEVYDDEIEIAGFRLSWGAIFGGFVVAMVVQILLSLLGLAIGFGALNVASGHPFEGISVGTGFWAVLSALIALFVGGLAAGYLAGHLTRFDGMIHGVLVWGITTIVTLWALTAGLGAVVGGAFGLTGETISSAVGGMSRARATALARHQGMPHARDAAGRQQVVTILTQRTRLTPQQAQAAADEIMQARQQQFQLQAEQVREPGAEFAGQVANTLQGAAWWGLLAAVVSLVAAAWGAAITARR